MDRVIDYDFVNGACDAICGSSRISQHANNCIFFSYRRYMEELTSW